PLAEIGPVLARLTREREKKVMHENPQPQLTDVLPEVDSQKLGAPTAFTCPDCGGTLWELEEAGRLRFRCRVGAADSPYSMLEAESDHVEDSLWNAIRVLKESAYLCRRAARTESLRAEFTRKAADNERHASVIRDFLVSGGYRDIPDKDTV